MFRLSSCARELRIVSNTSPVVSSVLMFSRSKNTATPRLLSSRTYFNKSSVFLANLEIDLTSIRSSLPLSKKFAFNIVQLIFHKRISFVSQLTFPPAGTWIIPSSSYSTSLQLPAWHSLSLDRHCDDLRFIDQIGIQCVIGIKQRNHILEATFSLCISWTGDERYSSKDVIVFADIF